MPGDKRRRQKRGPLRRSGALAVDQARRGGRAGVHEGTRRARVREHLAWDGAADGRGAADRGRQVSARCPPGVRIRGGSAAFTAPRRGPTLSSDSPRRNVVRRAHRSNAPSPTPMRGTCRSLHVRSRRRQGRYDRRRRGETKDRRFPDECRYRANGGGRRGAWAVRTPTASRLAADPRGARRRVAVALETSGMVRRPPPYKGSAPVRVAQGWDSEEERSGRPTSQISSSPSDPAAPLGSPGKVTPAPPGTTEREANAAAAAGRERGFPRGRTRRHNRQRGQVPDRVEAAGRDHLGDARRGRRRPREGRIR